LLSRRFNSGTRSPATIRRPTLKDVAQAAGVSVTTASVVLNDRREGIRVPEATRRRVQQAAEDLSYRPNILARSLRAQESRTIGFISDEVTTTPFAVSMLAAAQDEAARHGYLLFVVIAIITVIALTVGRVRLAEDSAR
jgi:LacI family transcriptional regulator